MGKEKEILEKFSNYLKSVREFYNNQSKDIRQTYEDGYIVGYKKALDNTIKEIDILLYKLKNKK